MFMLWLGLAAMLVGLLSFAIHPSWQAQILMFAVFAVATVPLWRRFARGSHAASKSNRSSTSARKRWSAACSRWKSRSSTAPGTVRIDDTIWRVPGRMRRREPREGCERWRQPDGGAA